MAAAAAPPSSPPSPSAASAAPAADAASPLAALPTDVLAIVFSFFPAQALLRAVGPVCKRWRTAALRAVRHFRWRAPEEFEGAEADARLGSILALFPALDSLRVSCEDLGAVTHCTALTSLKFALYAPRPDCPIFAAHFPHLATLRLEAYSVNVDEEHGDESILGSAYASFVCRHASSLTSLEMRTLYGVGTTDAVALRVAAAGLPRVRKLSLPLLGPAAALAVMRSAPQLRTLTLSIRRAEHLLELPPSHLTALTELSCVDTNFLARTRAVLEALPNLTHYRNTATVERDVPPRMVGQETLWRCSWESLAERCPNVRKLNVSGEWDGTVTAVRLPRLQAVHFMPSSRAAAHALSVMRAYPGLKFVSVALSGAEVDVRAAADALCAEAVRTGVRSLVVAHKRAERYTPAAMKCGWVSSRQPDP